MLQFHVLAVKLDKIPPLVLTKRRVNRVEKEQNEIKSTNKAIEWDNDVHNNHIVERTTSFGIPRTPSTLVIPIEAKDP